MHGREQIRVDALPQTPPSLDAERAIELDRLAEAALREQRQLVTDAIERAIGHLPRLLRGAARRALEG